jgi:drug/metabolite transporter (DMT)-like permease
LPFLGEAAALLTAACWACTSILFGFAVRHLGAFRLNLIRVTLAAVLLVSLALLFNGTGWLVAARPRDLIILSISGWAGLTLGDWAYFQALHLLGPRLATLFNTLSPPLTTLLGLVVLQERPGWRELVGMALTIAGVAWVVLERPTDGTPRGHRIRGSVCAVLGAAGQAVALVMSKAGMASSVGTAGGITPLPAAAVRMTAATAATFALALVTRRVKESFNPGRNRRVIMVTVGATILGPGVGIWLSLVAVQHTQAGIASTLISAVPVLVLPLVVFVNKERVSPRAVFGALLAVAGVAMLFLRGR